MKKSTSKKTLSTYTFNKKFPDEKAAREHVEWALWGDKPICPDCEGTNTIPRPARKGHHCKECRVDFTVRTGTIFENSRLGLHPWLYAIYLLQTSRKGISSMQLSKEVDITQKTSWFLLHRLRECCAISAIRLDGTVEIDEVYIGGLEANKHKHKKRLSGRGAVGKTAAVGARSRGGRRGGTVIAKVIDETDRETLHSFIETYVLPGSNVMTDESRAYAGLNWKYNHATVNHSAKEYVNGMESVWAVLKRGYNGVYHHWSRKHMQRYVNEFSFRLNQGNCAIDTIDRITSLIRNSCGRKLSYKKLTGRDQSRY